MADDFHLDARLPRHGLERLRPDRAGPAAAGARGRCRSGMHPDSRLYPRSRNAFLGWGTTLYLLGIALASIVGSAVGHLDWRPMGRFRDPQDPLFQALNSSISFDYRLAPYDIEQSLAHARMLAAQRDHRRPRTSRRSSAGSARSAREIDEDRFEVAAGRRGRAHGDRAPAHRDRRARWAASSTPRARATTRWPPTWPCSSARTPSTAKELLLALMGTLAELAERHLDWPLPGYTHLQRAQPVYLSHHLLAYFWKFRRDLQRFNFCLTATDDLPLGAGALAGVNFDTSRMFVAQELGFGGIAENSLDAVSNRDFVLDYLGRRRHLRHPPLAARRARSCSGRARSSASARCEDAFASGSSLMPQKKNPDAAELLRAKAPRVVSRLVGVHGVLHGLPLTYNKDLQEDKEPLFDAIDTRRARPPRGAATMLAGISFDRERMAAAAADEFIAATDVADALVRAGVPFREAHGIVGGAGADRGRARQAALRAHRRRAARAGAPARRRRSASCWSRPPGSSRRSRRAAPRSPACATSSRRPATCWKTRDGIGAHPPEPGASTTRSGARASARDLDRLRACRHGADGGPDRRDRELPPGGARLPRLRRGSPRARARSSARRAAPTSTSRTASTRCSTRWPSPRAWAPRC